MTKSELVPGEHIVETKDGDKFLVLMAKKEKIFGVGLNRTTYLHLTRDYYNEDLKYKERRLNALDIMKVYEISVPCAFKSITQKLYGVSSLVLIWERPKEPKEMTMKELEEELGYPVKIVKEK